MLTSPSKEKFAIKNSLSFKYCNKEYSNKSFSSIKIIIEFIFYITACEDLQNTGI